MRCVALLFLWVGALCAHPELRRILVSGTVSELDRSPSAASPVAFGVSLLIVTAVLVPGLLLGARWLRGRPFHVALSRALVLAVAGCALTAAAFGMRWGLAQAVGCQGVAHALGAAFAFALFGVQMLPVVAWWVILPMTVVSAMVLRGDVGPADSRAKASSTPPAAPPSAAARP